VNRSKVKKVVLVKPGVLVPKKGWFNAGYIFPKGYEAVVEYKSITDPRTKVPYTCSIKTKEGRPWFQLQSREVPKPFCGKSPTACWKQVLDAVNDTLLRQGDGVVRTQVAGPEYFGLNDPRIVEEIEKLDTQHLCAEYWKEKEHLIQARITYEKTNQRTTRKRPRSPSSSSDSNAAITADSFQDNYKGAWSCIERHSRYLKRNQMCGLVIMDDNPMPDYTDPITMQTIEMPAVSPYGHVAGYYTWVQVLKESRGICPFTKLPLTLESLTKLTKANYHRYEKSLILLP